MLNDRNVKWRRNRKAKCEFQYFMNSPTLHSCFNVTARMADVNEILKQSQEKIETFKPIHVEKNLELEFDLGNLLATDNNPINLLQYR